MNTGVRRVSRKTWLPDSARGHDQGMTNHDDSEQRPEGEDVPAADPPAYGTTERTWLSPDDDDAQRDEAAERAREAVKPGRERQ